MHADASMNIPSGHRMTTGDSLPSYRFGMSQSLRSIFGFVVTSFSVEWRIRDLYSRPQRDEHEFTSPRFRFLHSDWYLLMNFYGSGHIHNPGRIHLSLQKVCQMTGSDCFYADMSIRNTSYGNTIGRWSGECEIYVDEDDLGWHRPVEGAELELECVHEGANRFNSLTVCCNLTKKNEKAETGTQIPEADIVDEESGNGTSQHAGGKGTSEGDGKAKISSTGLDILSQNFCDLLLSERLSDVKIKIEGEEFLAHRAVLAARSPVFQAMLEHDTMEKNSGVIEICDCSLITFKAFLKCLYTGRSEVLSQENVCGVYQIADKYGVEHIKTECVAIMTRCLDETSFCDVISLATKHGELQLVKIATDYFVKHAADILPTVRWQTFIAENVTMANELFIKTLNKSG